MEDNLQGCRALVAGIISQAYVDAISPYREANASGARRFIDKDNRLFKYYCGLLGLEPEYVAKNLKKRIQKWDDTLLREQECA
jgi:hypothetical protein